MAKSAFDYSAVHVMSQWLSECFIESCCGFDVVEANVKSLADIIALTSGVGLSELWSGLSHRAVSIHDPVKVAELDIVSRHLPLALQGQLSHYCLPQ
jgi:midasin